MDEINQPRTTKTSTRASGPIWRVSCFLQFPAAPTSQRRKNASLHPVFLHRIHSNHHQLTTRSVSTNYPLSIYNLFSIVNTCTTLLASHSLLPRRDPHRRQGWRHSPPNLNTDVDKDITTPTYGTTLNGPRSSCFPTSNSLFSIRFDGYGCIVSIRLFSWSTSNHCAVSHQP